MDMRDDDYTDEEIAAAEARIERVRTVSEIFDAGFKAGLSQAGLREHSERDYRLWVMSESTGE